MEDFPLMVVAPGQGVSGLYAPHPILCTCDECTTLQEDREAHYGPYGLTP